MQNNPDNVELLIAGRTHSDWSSYEIDSDLLTPADAWNVSLGMSGNEMPPDVTPGAPVVLTVDGQTVLTGRIDEVTHTVNKNSHTFTMSGRDNAAALLDCAAPVFSAQQASLKQLVAALTKDFGKFKIRINADQTRLRKKVAIDPGDTAWNTLSRIAEANGLWPWFDPDGTLVIGGPDYSVTPVGALIMRRNGQGNNVLSLTKTESVAERFSKVTVYGQMPGSIMEQGLPSLHGSAEDTGLAGIWNRPKIVLDHEADSATICKSRAVKLVADARLQGYTLTAVVQGHTIKGNDMALLWEPGQRVTVTSEPHGIKDQVFFLMGRKFTRSRSEGTRTELKLKEDGVWAIEAHPHSHHRRGKNAVSGAVQ
jgi:prophage tail gpP-like protein